jgi:Protein of unknown function (DUF3618)
VVEDPSEIRQRIEESRNELAETVRGLAGKADIKGRLSESASQKAKQVQETVGELGIRVSESTPDGFKGPPLKTVGVVAVLLMVVLVVKIRRKAK